MSILVTTFQLVMDSYLRFASVTGTKSADFALILKYGFNNVVTSTTKGETAFSDFLVLEIGYFPPSSVVTVVTHI